MINKQKPFILQFAVNRRKEIYNDNIIYDPSLSINKWNGSEINFDKVLELMTKTEAIRESDDSEAPLCFLANMTKTFSSNESDD